MSEFAPQAAPERQVHHEALPAPEAPKLLTAAERGKHEQAQETSLSQARQELNKLNQHEAAPDPIEQLKAAENASAATPRQRLTRQMKQLVAQNELSRLRRQETPAERTLSKVIHQPAIRVVSEAAGKTISRPSGLLGGGMLAFVGSSAYLYLAKHLGFEYNYLIFLMLFAGGFGLGLLIELVTYSAMSNRRQALE